MKSKDTGHVDTTSRDTRTQQENSRDTGLCLENSWDTGQCMDMVTKYQGYRNMERERNLEIHEPLNIVTEQYRDTNNRFRDT